MLFNRRGAFTDRTPKTTPSGKFNVWKNSKGEWCIGNQCFTMKVNDEGVHVKHNPSARGCPKNLNEAYSELLKAVESGKKTHYVKPRNPDDW